MDIDEVATPGERNRTAAASHPYLGMEAKSRSGTGSLGRNLLGGRLGECGLRGLAAL